MRAYSHGGFHRSFGLAACERGLEQVHALGYCLRLLLIFIIPRAIVYASLGGANMLWLSCHLGRCYLGRCYFDE
jgi:hypothetical protein